MEAAGTDEDGVQRDGSDSSPTPAAVCLHESAFPNGTITWSFLRKVPVP